MNAEPALGRTAYTEEQRDQEATLLANIANGDRASFTELSKRYRGLIYSVVSRVINNREDCEDTTQDVLWQIWKKASTFDNTKGKPRTWITTMSRNRAIDRIRSNARRSRLRESATNEAAVADQFAASDISNPRFATETNDRRRLVRSAILELSPKQREAIELAYFADMTQRQVAEQLGEPIGTVKARIRRSMHRLQAIVGDELN